MTETSHARWIRVKGIVGEAIDLAPESRPDWIERACAGDQPLQDEVEALVRAHEQAGAFLEAPALASPGAPEHLFAATESPAEPPALPERFGAYRVLGELGRGGMGVVYLGARDDDRFDKRVAIKVVSGDVVHPAVLRRFEDERRILASLDHPNIARLLDAGTTPGGQPYVVMEHVEGVPIDAVCSTRRLGAAERLRLFVRVCAAVQYSHQHLVVHRDIKAGNILVTPDGVPKLLDFGIAKLLEPGANDGSRTRTAFRMLTPESASPEQLRGEPVTVATDVYSLGVLLYRLLTGRSPYRGGMTTDAEIVRAICEEEPLRPSDVVVEDRRDLRGDLDLITLKALRKDPERRYTSVEQLAQDVQRHLDRQPVLAAPDAWTYRTRKFVARHWVGLAAAAAVTLALAGGGATTWWQAKRAERRFNDVRQLAHTFMFDVHDAIAKLPGSTAARKLLVTEALQYLDSLASEAGRDASLQRELASGYEKMADVLGRPSTPNLGDVPGAVAAYRKAQAARERLLAGQPGNAELLKEMSSTSQKMSRAIDVMGDTAGATEEARKAVLIEETLSASDRSPEQVLRLASSYANHGYLLYVGDQTVDSLDWLRKGARLLEQLEASGWNRTEVQVQLANVYGNLALELFHGHPVPGVVPDLDAALDMQRKAVALMSSRAGEAASDTTLQRRLMLSTMRLGEILERTGDRRAARDHYLQGLAAAEQLARADAANIQAQTDFGWTCYQLGTLLALEGDTTEALARLNQAVRIFEPVIAADPANLFTRVQVARTEQGFGHAHAALGSDSSLPRGTRLAHWGEAKTRFRNAYAFWTEARDNGISLGADATLPETLAREIAKCDAARGTLRP